MPNLIDITGQRFGTFTVRARAPGPAGAKSAWWLASCDCGAELPMRGDCIKSGKSHCPKCSGAFQGRRAARLGNSIGEIIETHSEFVTECGCRIWMGRIDQSGYGRICIDGVETGAHRAAWVFANGAIPEGMWVLHHCDIPPCINDRHLFLGTPFDNVADMMRKQRHRFSHRLHR